VSHALWLPQGRNAAFRGIRVGPLVVNLEQTLLRCDLALETAFRLFRQHPLRALYLLAQLLGDRTRAISQLERHQGLEAEHLPYDRKVVDLLAAAKATGREIVLVSAHYRTYARLVADHLRVFDRVATPDELESGGFDYVAHSHPSRHPVAVWIEAIRLNQWAKNLLLFVPLAASHQFAVPGAFASVAIAFVLFGLCASSVYLINDFIDVRSDRQHPTKRFRPYAAGDLSARALLWVAPMLTLAAFAGAWLLLPPDFLAALCTYFALTFAYSSVLKRVMMLDVVVLAILYTLRIIAGVAAFGGNLTFWLLAFSMFIFVSLALAKRYAELLDARVGGTTDQPRGRGYRTQDLEMIASLGSASGYLAVMVLALYIQDSSTAALYRHPQWIWFACPLLLFWISRTWLLTHRGQMHQDPIVFAMTDRVSLLTGVLFGLIFVIAV
jgi:4-hydroxybenzoate polyprenyltransferase